MPGCFSFAYFLQGLQLTYRVFESQLDFDCGGHGQPGFPVQLRRNVFHGFVNFFDCWFESAVQVEGNDFRQGTNLLGTIDPPACGVRFDVAPVVLDNKGNLHRTDEGE
ncbi:hypothetical protein [Hymenobacter sp. B81]|uniref:hypothetical protein n=1 Tax=Hymenobacter sp. B81 TaxID=3344878 RepID=UPI0037DD5EC7